MMDGNRNILLSQNLTQDFTYLKKPIFRRIKLILKIHIVGFYPSNNWIQFFSYRETRQQKVC